MMVTMAPLCENCGGEMVHFRMRFEVRLPSARLVMDEVPSVRCEACDLRYPADHVRAQFDAVVAVAEEVEGATMRKDFSSAPLRPDDL